MTAKVEKTEEPEADQGLVLYSDGGCRPNPGPGGWGVHGYLYQQKPPKKGSGNPDHILTDRGYLPKSEAEKTTAPYTEITPVHYVDGFGSLLGQATNNLAELEATCAAFVHAAQWKITRVLVWSDSRYVCDGLTSWVHKWQRNNWMRNDGLLISNVDTWQRLVAARQVLLDRGVKVQIEWVRGHNDTLGNDMADALATCGVMASQQQQLRHEITTTKAEGYWGYDPERHPFLHHRRMYFNSQSLYCKPGEYYLGEHGKDDEMLGKRTADGAYACVYLGTPDPVLEFVRAYQCAVAENTDSLIMARLEQIYNRDTHKQISLYGSFALERSDRYKLDLRSLAEAPITRELDPPRIAMRAIDAIEDLVQKLALYKEQSMQLVVTNLTPILYETSSKTDKKGVVTTSMKLKPEYNVGFAALPVQAQYRVGTEDVSKVGITLTLGIDLPDRNALKRLETTNPKLSLITWLEAPGVFRFATVIEAGADHGIWAGVYSNQVVLPEPVV